MKLGILLLVIGIILVGYLSNVKLKKEFLSKLGIALGIALAIYGLILFIQPDDYIEFTKTTITKG